MRCARCDAENEVTARFCSQCGDALATDCSRCGHTCPPGSRFCNACGAAVSSGSDIPDSAPRVALSRAADANFIPEGERKVVTALFVDIIDSTGLSKDLDPEEARAIVDPALALMIESVRRYDGYVVQSTGDGIFALFGAPLAHEDHPQRSLYAALRVQREMSQFSDHLRQKGQRPLQIRAGVNTGEVVVRPIRTGERHTEYTPIGHTVNLASRIQTLANPGAIVVSESTRNLVEGYFALRFLGPSQVKGIVEPIQVYEVDGLGPLRTRLERSAGRGLSKFVGRDRERQLFAETARSAHSGAGQVVAVVAEPGVGKSRLIFELKADVGARWKILEAFAVSHGTKSPFVPIVTLLHDYFGLDPSDSPEVRRAKVAAHVEDLDPGLEAALPYLHALLEIEDDQQALGSMDPQLRLARTIDAVAKLFRSEAERQPLLLIVEDLHWLDDESQAILDAVVSSLENLSLLLLVNFRPEYQLKWRGQPNLQLLRLDPLDHDNADQLLSHALGRSVDLVPLKQLIIETTGGTPFFMEETLQSLFDEGALVRAGDGVKLVKPLESLRIPPTVQTILAARIDRLRGEEKMLLQALAVLGREFFLGLARLVVGHSDATLGRLFDKLQIGEFVYEQPSISDVKYVFKHALTQEVAYGSILAERRRKLHEDVGRAIEELYQSTLEQHFNELAHHYSLSANREKAFQYLLLTGVQALSRGAVRQAVQSLEGAQALIAEFPDGPQKDASELKVLSALATALIAARGYAAPEVGPHLQRARELRSRVDSPHEEFAVLRGMFAWRVVRGDLDIALALAKEAVAIADVRSDPGMWMEALFLMVVASYYRSDFVEVEKHTRLALSEYDDDPERTWSWAMRTGEHAGVTHRCYRALALWHIGYADEAQRLNRETFELTRALSHPFSVAYALHHSCLLHYYLGMPTRLSEFANEQVQFCTDQGFPLFRATGTIFVATAALIDGDAHGALPGLVKGLDAYRSTGAGLAVPYYFGLLGAALIKSRRLKEAEEALDTGLEIAMQNADRFHDAELHRLKGDLALSQDHPAEEVQKHYQTAFELAHSQQSRAMELRAATSAAKLAIGADRPIEALHRLSTILSQFAEGLGTTDVTEARAVLGRHHS